MKHRITGAQFIRVQLHTRVHDATHTTRMDRLRCSCCDWVYVFSSRVHHLSIEMISASVAADSALDRCHTKHEIRSHSARPHQTLGEKLVPPVKSANPAFENITEST